MTTNAFSQVNNGRWCQETYETGTNGARQRARLLRKAGYLVAVEPMGQQVTHVGLIKLTLVTIYPGTHSDTLDLSQ